MSRAFGKVKGSVWSDADWKQLEPIEQWAYVLLLSQPQMNNCGVLPYVVTRWARLASGLTIDVVNTLMDRLEDARFIIVDHETAEVLVRTFIKHDEIEKQPNLVKAAKRQYHEIQSPRIRLALATEYPHLFELTDAQRERLETDVPEPLPKDLSEPLPKDLPEGVSKPRARARDLHLHLQPSPQQQTAANGTATDPAAAIEKLKAAGWSNGQLEGTDPQRALAWLEHYAADPTAKKPSALAWTTYSSTDAWPETKRSEIARGAVGTRSTSPPLPDRAAEPDPEPAPPPKDFLKLAGRKTPTGEPPAPPKQAQP